MLRGTERRHGGGPASAWNRGAVVLPAETLRGIEPKNYSVVIKEFLSELVVEIETIARARSSINYAPLLSRVA